MCLLALQLPADVGWPLSSLGSSLSSTSPSPVSEKPVAS